MTLLEEPRGQQQYENDEYGVTLPFEDFPSEEMTPFAVHQCNVCNKIFMSFKGLQQHAVIHTDTKPFICDVCGRGFRFKSNMFEHRSVHTGYTPHLCPFCGKQFRLKGNMKKHMRVHVSNKEELEAAYRPYSSNRRSTLIPDNALVIRGSPMPFLFADKRRMNSSAPKLLLGKDSSKWVDMIIHNQLIPTTPYNEKMLRATMRLAGPHSCRQVLEQAKPLEFEIFNCPICNIQISGKEGCRNHLWEEHQKKLEDMRAEPNCCLKCLRKFTDENIYLQHQSYHSRVHLMLNNRELEIGSPEVDIAQICYSLLRNPKRRPSVDIIVSKPLNTSSSGPLQLPSIL